MRTALHITTSIAITFALASPSLAGDGRVQINQACALAGCFPGDAPGFPVTLDGSAGTSYVVTSDLVVADAALDGIEITADDVAIDLNGFELAGPVSCAGSGSTVVCDPGSGRGVDALSADGVTLRRGSIRGFGSEGAYLGERARIEEVSALSNGDDGLRAGELSIIVDSRADGNGDYGIWTGGYGIVERTSARANRLNGIQIGLGSSAVSCNGSENGWNGLNTFVGGVIRDSGATLNEDNGIDLGHGTLATDNTATSNGENGMLGSTASLVRRNVLAQNGDHGLDNSQLSSAAYADNTINENTAGTVDGIFADLGGNVCDGAVGCP